MGNIGDILLCNKKNIKNIFLTSDPKGRWKKNIFDIFLVAEENITLNFTRIFQNFITVPKRS